MYDLSKLSVDKARSSVVVTSLPESVDREDIIIYFQSRKHGGGDINEVSLLGNGAALVVFEDEKCVQNVLEKDHHVIRGISVTVKSCPDQDQKVTYNVFSKVSAKIYPKDLHISVTETRVLLQSLPRKVNVKCVEESGSTFVISGTYQQIVKSHDILCDLLDSHRRNQPAPINNGQVHTAKDYQTRLPISRREINGTIDTEELNEQRTHTNQDTSELATKECQGTLFKEIEISETEWSIFSKVCKKQLAQLMEAYRVIVEPKKEMGKLMIKPTESCSKDMLNEATERLSQMYLTEGKKMHCARFCLVQSNSTQQANFRQAVLEVNKAETTIVERAPDRQSWEIFGEIDEVEEILKSLESMFELKRLDIEEENGQTQVDVEHGRKLHREVLMQNSDQDDDDENDEDEEDLDIRFSHDLGCVRVSVYRDDITNETCDAIVNAANQTLSHGAGVAKAIVSKGGQSIQDESTQIIATKGKLEVGEATITSAGKLRCKTVIHAVGPVWNNNEKKTGKMLLKKACFSSLQQAQNYGFNSIAFPAISSGIYRMPKKLCAKVMFDVIEEYNNSISPSQAFKVTDIRFVSNDLKTVKIFQKEFKERYSEEQRITMISLTKPESNRAELPGQSSHQIMPTKQVNHINKSTHGASENLVQRNKSKGASLITKYLSTSDESGGARPKQYYKVAPQQKRRKRKEDEREKCPICLARISKPTTLPACKHTFCKICLGEALKKSRHCPLCRESITTSKERPPNPDMQTFNSYVYHDGSHCYNDPLPTSVGGQPTGTMKHRVEHFSLPGYEDCGTILIQYSLNSGVQGPDHPNPGHGYDGTSRTAYLPDNHQGRDVMKMLKRAFHRGLVFKVGRSITSGYDNQIVWGDIPHKTCINGGPLNYGYPDPTYLTDVQGILKVILHI